jgi:type IV pilus assembly protein PilX
MISITTSTPRRQRGVALIAAMLILIVITILGIAMFRSYGMQQRIGSNTRDKARALHSAITGEDFAEWFLSQNNGANAVLTATCTGTQNAVTDASTGVPMVCSNIIPSTVESPDTWGAAFTYQPTGMVMTSGALDSYSKVPQFYISSLGSPSGGPAGLSPIGVTQAMFQIDAAGWGATPQAVAVVESSYIVLSTPTPFQPSSSGIIPKGVFQGSQQ